MGDDKMEHKQDEIACSCLGVTYGDIVDAISNGAKTYEEVSQITGCGTICGECEREIADYVAEQVAANTP